MAGKENGFNAYVYEDDYVEIQKLVQHYPNIETGGDLFGLWQDKENVVIQLFIGPGKRSQRTTTSFHQDVEYLHKVGTVITKEEGLCNLGEWHSHHQIGMPAPSAADKRTVLSNLTQLGLERFVLFIASIDTLSERKKRHHDIALEQIKINCFMFREGLPDGQQPIKGKITLIKGRNPLRLKNKAGDAIRDGAERPPQRESMDTNQGKVSRRNAEEEYGSGKPPERMPAGRQNDENKSPNTGGNQMGSHPTTSRGASQQVSSPHQAPIQTDHPPSSQQISRTPQPNPIYSDLKSQRSTGRSGPATTGQHVSSTGSQSHGHVSRHQTFLQTDHHPPPPSQQLSRATQRYPIHSDFNSQRSFGSGHPATTDRHDSSIGSQSHGLSSRSHSGSKPYQGPQINNGGTSDNHPAVHPITGKGFF